MLKILQARLQQYVNHGIPGLQAGFLKRQRNQRSDCQHLLDHRKSKMSSRKTSISALLAMPKPLSVWITTNCAKFLEMGILDHLICLLRSLYAGQEATVRTRTWNNRLVPNSSKYEKEYIKVVQLELDMEQQTSSK